MFRLWHDNVGCFVKINRDTPWSNCSEVRLRPYAMLCPIPTRFSVYEMQYAPLNMTCTPWTLLTLFVWLQATLAESWGVRVSVLHVGGHSKRRLYIANAYRNSTVDTHVQTNSREILIGIHFLYEVAIKIRISQNAKHVLALPNWHNLAHIDHSMMARPEIIATRIGRTVVAIYQLVHSFRIQKVARPCGTNLQLAAETCEFAQVPSLSMVPVRYYCTVISLFMNWYCRTGILIR